MFLICNFSICLEKTISIEALKINKEPRSKYVFFSYFGYLFGKENFCDINKNENFERKKKQENFFPYEKSLSSFLYFSRESSFKQAIV